MTFNYHSALKPPIRLHEAHLDFKLPQVSLNHRRKDADSLRSNNKGKSNPKEEQKRKQRNDKDRKGLISYPQMKKASCDNRANKQNKNVSKQRSKQVVRVELGSKNTTKSIRRKDSNEQLTTLFQTINRTISQAGLLQKVAREEQTRASKYLKRSALARQKYQLSRSDVLAKKASLYRSSGNLLQNLQSHMSTLFDLEEQASSTLKDYIENRGLLENLRENQLFKRRKRTNEARVKELRQ